MLSRRDFLSVACATAALTGIEGRKAWSQGTLTQDDLLKFPAKGQVTILHLTDCHAQLMPIYYREPSINIGVGEADGKPPHITGADFLKANGIKPGTLDAYALSSEDFVALAKQYGRVGGMDRMATMINAIRAERGEDRTLLLDGGDTLQGSFTSLESKGGDMIRVTDQLRTDAMTGHWDFTYGTDRVTELFGNKDESGSAKTTFLAGNVIDDEWQEPVFKHTAMYEKGGVKIAVIGQAFPFTPIANPRHFIPTWSFGIRERLVRERVEAARKAGAQLVVLLSHNGFDVDRKLASRVEGIDVVLTGHTHDALPSPVKVGKTLLIATGSSTKYLSRLDIDVQNGRMAGYAFRLIPILTNAIKPDPAMKALVSEIRAPHEKMLTTELGRTESLLYRRGNFNGTFDDLICNALLEQRDAEIALSPGFRWGPSLLPGQAITWDDVYNETAMTYPACYRLKFSGKMLKDVLEDVADNLFNIDPYYQQGGDMVRVGGMGYSIDIDKKMGSRISDMTLLKTGEPIDAKREYVVAGWASVNEGTEGPAVWDVVADHLRGKGTVSVPANNSVKVKRSPA